MDITLPAELTKQVEQELASGTYQNSDQLIAEAIRYFLEDRRRAQRRLDALRRIGGAVDEAGLYEQVLVPNAE
jgi:Arc/MetJ-type ribon-helix-helix transcriptional regulator